MYCRDVRILLVFLALICCISVCAAFEPSNLSIDPPRLEYLETTDNLDLIIVYNGYIYPKRHNWLELFKEQLDGFNCNGLAKRAKHIYISLTMDRASELNETSATLANLTISTIREIHPKALFDLTLENRYEYPGIRTMWDVAQGLTEKEAQNTIIIYMHSKGMFHTAPNFHGTRIPEERLLFHATFDPWDHVLHMFQKHPTLNKVGCIPAESGFIWFNIYYARASYVQRLVNPTVAKSRYYYESWLSYVNPHPIWPQIRHIEFTDKNMRPPAKWSGCADCWSIIQGKKNETFGVFWTPKNLPWDYLNKVDWYKCREPTVLAITNSTIKTA